MIFKQSAGGKKYQKQWIICIWYQKLSGGEGAVKGRYGFSHPLVDVDGTVAVGAAVLHILAGVDAERDATAQEEPGGVETREINEIADLLFLFVARECVKHGDEAVTQKRPLHRRLARSAHRGCAVSWLSQSDGSGDTTPVPASHPEAVKPLRESLRKKNFALGPVHMHRHIDFLGAKCI